MTINQNLLNQIISNVASATNVNLRISSKVDILYQAYIFSLIVTAARNEGAIVRYESRQSATPRNFIWRAKPGYIYSNRHEYTYAVIEFVNKPILEIHMGVRVIGKSKVLHECDISVIRRTEALSCYTNAYHPQSSKIILAVECKFYTNNLDLNLARSFIGLDSDLSIEQGSYFVSNSSSDSVNKFLNNRKKLWEHNIAPNYPNDVTRLLNLFQKTFEGFKASN